MLAEVAGNVVQVLLDVGVLEVEGRPGQPRLDLRGGVLGLGEQGRVVGAYPVGDQRAQAAQDDGGDEQGDPGRGHVGQPGPLEPGLHRLQHGGEQQRRDARHDDDVDNAQDARDQVEADGQQQQPPGPRGRRGQPARHTALLRHGYGPGRRTSWGRLPRASLARLSSRTAVPRAICSLTPVPRAIRSSLSVAPSPAWPRAGRSAGVPFSAPPCGAPPPAAASWFMTYGYRSAGELLLRRPGRSPGHQGSCLSARPR